MMVHRFDTYLFLLFIKIINNDTNEQVEGEESSKYDEEHKVEVHEDVPFSNGLLAILQN